MMSNVFVSISCVKYQLNSADHYNRVWMHTVGPLYLLWQRLQHVFLYCMNHRLKETKHWLMHIHFLCIFRGKSISVHKRHLNSCFYLLRKKVIRRWRMAHFVDYQQWVFFQLQRQTIQSQYSGEVTVNQQMLTIITRCF